MEWFGEQCTPCHQPFLTTTPPRIDQLPLQNTEMSTVSSFGHSQQVNSICIYAANTRALSASSDGTLKVWDLNTYSVRHTLSGGHGGYSVLSCEVANGTRALSGGADHKLRVWDLENHTILGHAPYSSHCGPILCLKAVQGFLHSSSSKQKNILFFSASADSTIKKWKVSMDGVAIVLASMIGHEGPVRCLTLYGSDQTKLVSGGSDGLIKIWDNDKNECVTTLNGHNGSINCCDILECNDMILLVTGSSDESLKVWNLNTLICTAFLHGHFESVTCCHLFTSSSSTSSSLTTTTLASNNESVYHPGIFLISGSFDESLKIWEIPTFLQKRSEINDLEDQQNQQEEQEVEPMILNYCHTLSGHVGGITCCAPSSDGLTALSGSYDKTMKVWDLPIIR